MAVHKAMTKTSARTKAKKYRKMGLNASFKKVKKGYKVYTDQKGKR